MNASELHRALTKLRLPQPFLQREIAVLKRKKLAKREPYCVLSTVLMYLYCMRDTDRFLELFRQFVEAEMESHFGQIQDLWSWVERSILLYSHLTGDSKHDRRIRDKGFVEDRLTGSLLHLYAENLKAELGEFRKGYPLPKSTIVSRYQALIAECLAILRLKKSGAPKEIRNRLERYRQLFLAAVECFPLKDEQFLAGLKRVSDELV